MEKEGKPWIRAECTITKKQAEIYCRRELRGLGASKDMGGKER